MPTLMEKAESLREQIGLAKDLTVAEVIHQSVEQLGLGKQTSDLNLIAKADAVKIPSCPAPEI